MGRRLSQLVCLVWRGRPVKPTQRELLEKIMATQAELATDLRSLKTQTDKIALEQSTRFDAQTAAIQRLTDLLNAGTVTAEVQTALDALKTATQALDDTIPDAPANPA